MLCIFQLVSHRQVQYGLYKTLFVVVILFYGSKRTHNEKYYQELLDFALEELELFDFS